MATEDLLDVNPGEQLRDLIQKLIPFEPLPKTSFVDRIDTILMADGEFARLAYASSLNYLIRRLITTSEFLKRKYSGDQFPSDKYVQEIRRFIRDYTRISSVQAESVLSLVLTCLDERNRAPSQTAKDRIRAEAKRSGTYCYICGREIEFEQINQYNSFDAEHKWPKAMGGKNSRFNLKQVCRRCNIAKADFIDYTDFHYEEMCLVSDKASESFSNDLKWDYRVALWAKNDFRCIICNEPAEHVGELQFARREPSDSWHFLNIDAYCSRHLPLNK